MRFIKIQVLGLVLVMVMVVPPVWAANPQVNINVTNGEVRDVLTALAAVGGVSIVADDAVTGKITIQLQNISFETALDIVVKTKGLNYQKVGNVIVIGTAEQMNRGFGEIYVFKLQYAKAADVMNLLGVIFKDDSKQSTAPTSTAPANPGSNPSQVSPTLSQSAGPSSRLKYDEVTNSLIFSGSQSEVDQIKQILSEVDIPYQQVSLEAQVVALTKDASQKLGVEWEWSKTPQYPEYKWDKDNNQWTITRKPLSENGSVAGIIQFGRTPEGHPYEFYYQAQINAMVAAGKANVLSRPGIMTINGKEAVINIGGEVPIPTTTVANGVTTTGIEYREAGIILKYTPRINADGYITAKVHTEVSTPTYVSDMKAYQFSKRSADTEVRLKDGETMVIGGLIGKEESKAMSKVPFLGDLPILGRLFSNINTSKNETEVVIFLTAHIVKSKERG